MLKKKVAIIGLEGLPPFGGAANVGDNIIEQLAEEYEFTVYAKQVITNAQAMAKAFVEKGYQLISSGTDNHLMLIDLRNKNISGKKAEQALVKADITLNKNMVPFDDKSAFVTSGIRIGTPAITTRGLKEEHMQFVVNCVDNVVMNADDENVITTVRKQVNEFMRQFSLYPELG